MTGPFHSGERAVQQAAGVLEMADAVGRGISREVGLGAARFLAKQRFLVAASVDGEGRIWASLLTGPAGFASALDPELVHIKAALPASDPLGANLISPAPLGLLAIDLETRQRVRFNGRGMRGEGGIFLDVEQVYGNCPKYIQRRAIETSDGAIPGATVPSERLDSRQEEWIRRADTFFIATAHPARGADASHRGGLPGFVTVESPARISFPDYPGNAMFNTLGNLVTNPNAGLLFVDFVEGGVLQLSGQARLDAARRVTFDVVSVRQTPDGSSFRFRFIDFSPANPPIPAVTPRGLATSEP